MLNSSLRTLLFLALSLLVNVNIAFSGPPFNTDDPEPVDFRHWEYYISSINNHTPGTWSGTLPHLEFNYGVVPGMQLHVLLPMNYTQQSGHENMLGYADTEVGIKYRFIRESDNSPMVGIFPIVEIPTIKNNGFSDGKTKIYLPVWLQKSWGKLSSYGGAGYWINPGTNNKNWIFTGWELQYEFSKTLMLGGEVFYHTASTNDSKSVAGFNIGGSVNPSEKFHIIFSAGHSVTKDKTFSSYFGLLWTI